MASSDSGAGENPVGGALVGAAVSALPPEIQALIKPGKTSSRVQKAIAWAARLDPEIIELHRKHDRSIRTMADVRAASLTQKDAVARVITRRYRRRAMWTGAVTGLPGGLWALVAGGADVELTAIYAARMAAMVSQAYGFDTSLLEEQAHLADVLALIAGIDSLRGIGRYLTSEGFAQVIPEVLVRLLGRMSIKLTEDQAGKLIGRLIPGVGAVVGATIDYGFLRVAGDRATAYYHNRVIQEQALVAAGHAPTASAGPAGQSAALPAPMPFKHSNWSPGRFLVYLTLFAILTLGVTVLACGALGVLAVDGIVHLVQNIHL